MPTPPPLTVSEPLNSYPIVDNVFFTAAWKITDFNNHTV